MDATIFVDSSPDVGSRFWFEVSFDGRHITSSSTTPPQRGA
jgi:hypothetical protein